MIKIGILSISENHDNASLLGYFAKYEKDRGAKSVIIYPQHLEFSFGNGSDKENEGKRIFLYYKGKKIKLDVILPRIDSDVSHKDFMVAVNAMDFIRNHTDIPIINYTKGMLISNDKFWQGEYIAAHGYKTPKTALLSSADNISKVLKDFNNKYPLIVKSQFGAGGAGVAIVESERSAKSVISSMILNGTSVVVQDYLPVEGGTDYRLFVIGNRVAKGIMRTAPKGDFRANVVLGGGKGYFKPSKELQNVAVDIANLVGLEIAAVDFMYYNNQYYFIEINKNPGTKKDPSTAKMVLDYVIERSKKKIKKIKHLDKKYKISSVKGVKKVFSDLDVNLVGLGKKPFRRIVPSYFADKYHVLSYAKTNDYQMLKNYLSVRSVSEKDTDFVNYNAYLHTKDDIDYANIENYLRKLKDVHLLVYKPDEKTSNIINQIPSSVVYANKKRTRDRFENKISFRKFLEKNKIKVPKYSNYLFSNFLDLNYKKIKDVFGNKFVVHFPKDTAVAGRNTFVIYDDSKFNDLIKMIKKQNYRHEEISEVDISEFIDGKSVVINGCVTHQDVLLGEIGVDLVDMNSVYSSEAKYRNKRCGVVWGNGLIEKLLREKIEELVGRVGNLVRKKSKYKGIFSFECVVDKDNNIYPVGFKTHSTSSSFLEDLIYAQKGKIPMEAFQIMESFGIKYNYNHDKIVKEYKGVSNGYSMLYLYNITNKTVQLKGDLKPGIYTFDKNGKFKFSGESINVVGLKKDEFLLVESITSSEFPVEVQDADTKIMSLVFKKSIVDNKGMLSKNASDIVKNIYKNIL